MTNHNKVLPMYQRFTALILLIILSFSLGACGDITATSVGTSGSASNAASTQALATATKPVASLTTSVVISNAVNSGTMLQIFPTLEDIFATTTAIHIEKDLDMPSYGYRSHYTLTPQGNNFVGEADFQATNGASGRPLYDTTMVLTTTVTIETPQIQSFLHSLTLMSIGQNEAANPGNNTYPKIAYQIDTAAGSLSLYSSFNDPNSWEMDFAGRHFTLEIDQDKMAADLKPYLHEELIDQLLSEASLDLRATATPAPAQPVASGTLGQLFPDLANLATIPTSLYIQDDLAEFSSGYTAHYSLSQQASGFTGTGEFQATNGVGADGMKHFNTDLVLTRTITIPLPVVQDFLQSVTQLPVQEGKYNPDLHLSDLYPVKNYQIATQDGLLTMRSIAQDTTPWAIDFAGREFVVNSPLAPQAISKLAPYLQHKDATTEVEQKAFIPAAPPTPEIAPTPTVLPLH